MSKLYQRAVAGTLTLVACLCLPLCASATVIIVLQTKDRVLVGADSRVISLRAGAEGEAATSGQMCKIVQTPRTAVAIAGILGNQSGFESASFLQEHVADDLPLEQAADNLAREMAVPLRVAILDLEHAAPDQRLVQSGRPALSMIMSRFENGYMKTAVRDMVYLGRVSGSPQFRVDSQNCPGSCRGLNMVFAAGTTDAVTKFLLSHSERSRLKDPAFALRLLHLEADAEPDTVGPPFSILEGDRNGFHWLAPGACQNAEFAVSGILPARRGMKQWAPRRTVSKKDHISAAIAPVYYGVIRRKH
jgi:hypothetical protein